jgi:subtilisin family serine protease
VLVLMRDESDEKTLRAFGRRQRLDFVQSRQLALIGKTVHRYRIANGRDLRLALRNAARDPRVAWIQPNYLYRLQGEAANPDSLTDASGPEPAGSDSAKPDTAKLESALPAEPAQEIENAPPGSYAGRALNLQRAHKIAGGAGVRVAVIDSLIDAAHPEIDGAVADRFDAVASAGQEPQAHGTAMAGAIGGHRKLDGVAPQAELLAVRAFGDRGDATRAVSLDIAAGVDWAAAKGAKVINMSFAGPRDPLLGEMLSAAAKKGLILVAAAGNDGPRAAPLYPAAYAEVIAVSAVDEQARIYDKAARGPYVALAAPGVDVLVAAPRGAYDLSTGTSVACAEVSGIVALLLEKRPGLAAAALRALLRETAKTLSGQQGLGEADALAAVERN